jgi:hypothetical protein
LLEDCSGAGFVAGVCFGFIIGTYDAMEGGDVDGYKACLPNGVTAGQLKDVAVFYGSTIRRLRRQCDALPNLRI